jgi:hypothetical protein
MPQKVDDSAPDYMGAYMRIDDLVKADPDITNKVLAAIICKECHIPIADARTIIEEERNG